MQISRMYYGGEITTDWIAALWGQEREQEGCGWSLVGKSNKVSLSAVQVGCDNK